MQPACRLMKYACRIQPNPMGEARAYAAMATSLRLVKLPTVKRRRETTGSLIPHLPSPHALATRRRATRASGFSTFRAPMTACKLVTGGVAPGSLGKSADVIPEKRHPNQQTAGRRYGRSGESGRSMIRFLGIFARMIGLASCIATLPHGAEPALDDASIFAAGYYTVPAIGIDPERKGQHWYRGY